MLTSPPVPVPVLLQPSIFLFPLFAPLHLVQFAAPVEPSQHGKRIGKRLCYAWDSHTLDQQPTACNSETLSLSCWTWSKGRNKQNVMRLFETESVVKLVSRCTIAPVIACLLCGSYTQVSWCYILNWVNWVNNDQPQERTSTKMYQFELVWCM